MIQTLCRGWDSFPRNRLVNITVPATFGFPQGHNLQLSCYFFLHSCYSTTFFSHSQLPTIFPSIHSVHFLCLVCKQAINVLSSTKIIKNTARSFIKRLPLTQVQMWFPVHLDDIVKAHQSKSLQKKEAVFSETARPERQHRSSFQMDSLHATHKPPYQQGAQLLLCISQHNISAKKCLS